MCGICGHVGSPGTGMDLDTLRSMRDSLTHRGPDGSGELVLRSMSDAVELECWMGHRRLKIVDLSQKAHQPMVSDDGLVALVYNGEVYNFRELRRELEAMGHRVRSSGDTEVVLRAYEAWGEDFVTHLDGMFALAIWDARTSRLVLARDRSGKKPLFYAVCERGLTFGSEIKALLPCPWIDRRPAWAHLPQLLTFGYVPHPATMLEGIQQVPPASVVAYGENGLLAPRHYWSALPAGPEEWLDREGHERIAELLEAATRRRLVSDVPLGALLSGGIDSSLVVALMSRAMSDPVHTFSIGFPEEPSFDERGYARGVAEHLGTRHTEFGVTLDALTLIDRLLWHHDQPFGDSSAIPTYVVSQLAREHVTVVLNGDGGDEVFAGYERFKAAAFARRIPGPVAAAALASTGVLPDDGGYHGLRRRAQRFLELADQPLRVRYQDWISLLRPEAVQDLVAPQLERWAQPDTITSSMDLQYRRAAHLPQLDQILLANFNTYLADDLNVKMDRMSMANSLETRSPFLDTELIEFMARVPARQKVGLRHPKPLLRKAFGPLLPDWVWQRRKHGFGVPVGRWLRDQLGVVFGDEVLGRDARSAEVVNPDAVRRIWSEHRSGQGDYSGALWTLLTVERWLRLLEKPPELRPPAADPVLQAATVPPV